MRRYEEMMDGGRVPDYAEEAAKHILQENREREPIRSGRNGNDKLN